MVNAKTLLGFKHEEECCCRLWVTDGSIFITQRRDMVQHMCWST